MEKDYKTGTGNLSIQREGEPDIRANVDTGQEFYAVRSTRVMIRFPVEKDSGPDENKTGPDIPDGQELVNYEKECSARQPQLYSEEGETAGAPQAPQDGLLFYGAVREENNKVVEGVAVMVFACCKDSTERLLGYTFSGNEGTYMVNIPDISDYKDITGFIVRAGGTTREPEKVHGSRVRFEGEKHSDSPHKDLHSFLKYIYNYPHKSIHDLRL